MLSNWSFSTLMQYETCAYRVKLSKIDRSPEPPRDPASDPLERGNREHTLYERFVKGELADLSGSTARGITPFQPLFKHARELYSARLATAEQNWLFDAAWDETERGNQWLWAKLDLCVTDETGSKAVVVDYKTGKSGYKTAEHIQQLQLYGALTALKFPWAETLVAELWYVDEGHISPLRFTREQALSYVGRFDQRAQRLMGERFWRPNPNKHNCRYCPYSPRGTGACAAGV